MRNCAQELISTRKKEKLLWHAGSITSFFFFLNIFFNPPKAQLIPYEHLNASVYFVMFYYTAFMVAVDYDLNQTDIIYGVFSHFDSRQPTV